ncbi:MAG: ABC transporter ATP-binding protein [candidate division WOR-3 bacterium]
MSILLETKNLTAGYKGMVVINKIDICLEKNEIVAIVGPNGSGKTTILRSLVGILDEYGGEIYEGNIFFKGKKINGKKPYELLHLGIVFVPDSGRVFRSMSVFENLEMGGFIIREKKKLMRKIEEVLELFPILKELLNRRAGNLSAGERQILSLGKALVLEPEVLILDEPSAGLSPNYVKILFEKLKEIKNKSGIIVVEQNAKIVLEYADRGYVIRNGEIKLEGKSKELLEKEDIFKLL